MSNHSLLSISNGLLTPQNLVCLQNVKHYSNFTISKSTFCKIHDKVIVYFQGKIYPRDRIIFI